MGKILVRQGQFPVTAFTGYRETKKQLFPKNRRCGRPFTGNQIRRAEESGIRARIRW
jgi:hypothetical protein